MNNCSLETTDYDWPTQWRVEPLASAALSILCRNNQSEIKWCVIHTAMNKNWRIVLYSDLVPTTQRSNTLCCVKKRPHTNVSYKFTVRHVRRYQKTQREITLTENIKGFNSSVFFFILHGRTGHSACWTLATAQHILVLSVACSYLKSSVYGVRRMLTKSTGKKLR
jgi:hypothetical protein